MCPEFNHEHISDADYQHALNVRHVFKCQTLGDYHDLVLKTDVLLLAEVFENLRKVIIKVYKLDPACYYTSPGLSWDTMLKLTKVELQLITDIDQYLMDESELMGDIL